MARRRNRVVQYAIRYGALVFCHGAGWMPLWMSRPAARALARLAYYVVPRFRRVGRANLDRAYGDALSPGEKRRILMESVENIAVLAVEFPYLPRMDSKFVERHVAVKGLGHLDRSRGSIIVGSHLGNWEWMLNVVMALGLKGAAVSRPLDDPRLDAYVDAMRTSRGAHTIPKDGAWEKMLKHIEEGWLMGILIDQSPREHGVPAQFFGQPCWATVAPALAARRTGAPVHAVSMARGPGGDYTLEFFPAIPMVRSGNASKDLVENTQRCQDAIEAIVRRTPGQWLWLHRRWKARPRLEAEWKAHHEGTR